MKDGQCPYVLQLRCTMYKYEESDFERLKKGPITPINPSLLLRTCCHGWVSPWQVPNAGEGSVDQEVHRARLTHLYVPVTKVVYCMNGVSWLSVTPVYQFLHQLGTRPSYRSPQLRERSTAPEFAVL